MKQYFYITIHFSPKYEEFLFTNFDNNCYQNIETGEIYQKRKLYDFGWGQEDGFELLPQLSFEDLIGLVEQPSPNFKKYWWKNYSPYQIQCVDIWRNNIYGAVSVIMQDYVEELIDFLFCKINTDYFSNPGIRENFRIFSFDAQKTRADGKIPGGVLTHSYEDILNKYPKWREISSVVKNQVYMK